MTHSFPTRRSSDLWWSYRVLVHFYAYPVPADFIRVLDLADATDIEPQGRIELQRVATCGGFGISEHDSDLFTKLVDEKTASTGFASGGGELAHSLLHQPGLPAHLGLPHFPLHFPLWNTTAQAPVE